MEPLTQLLQSNEWELYRYKIKLRIKGSSYKAELGGFQKLRRRGSFLKIDDEPEEISDTKASFGSFSFLHMVILAKKIKVLKYLILHKGGSSEYLR